MTNSRQFEHELVQKSVVGRHVADDYPQMVICVPGSREALQDFGTSSHPRNELRNEFFIVPIETPEG